VGIGKKVLPLSELVSEEGRFEVKHFDFERLERKRIPIASRKFDTTCKVMSRVRGASPRYSELDRTAANKVTVNTSYGNADNSHY